MEIFFVCTCGWEGAELIHIPSGSNFPDLDDEYERFLCPRCRKSENIRTKERNRFKDTER